MSLQHVLDLLKAEREGRLKVRPESPGQRCGQCHHFLREPMKASGICEVRKNKHYPRAGTPLYCCQSKKACLDFDERGERPIRYNDCIRAGQIAQAVEWLTEMAEILESEKRYTDALKLGMLTFYFATSGVYAEPVIEDRLAKQICRIVRETHLTLHEREELFLDTIRDDTLPEHIMSAKDCAYIFDVCAAGRVEDAREMLGRFVTAHVAK